MVLSFGRTITTQANKSNMKSAGQVLLIVALVCILAPEIAHGQFLTELRGNVRAPRRAGSDPEPAPEPNHHHRRDACEDNDRNSLWDTLFDDVLRAPVLLVAFAPFWGPRVLAEDGGGAGAFCNFPYQEPDGGQISAIHLAPSGESAFMTRWRFEVADDFDDLSKIGGQLLVDTASRFGFDTEFNYFHEDFRRLANDQLWLGDVNFVYRFAQSARLQMRSGIGFNWLYDETDSDFGFNFTYGGDWFPVKPWVFSTEFDMGRLGSASLFHGRATIGVQLRHTELYLGYDYLDVGDAQSSAAVAGLRFWF